MYAQMTLRNKRFKPSFPVREAVPEQIQCIVDEGNEHPNDSDQ